MGEHPDQPKHLTIICPIYNEAKVLPRFFLRLKPVIDKLSERYRVDLLFLNNASTDGTYELVEALRQEYPFIYVITLSSNVGYQRSLRCGLHEARGDILIFLDADGEDPPEMLLEFIEYYEKGSDIVYGERVDREEGRFMKALRKIFYHVVKFVADEDIILYMAEFSLLTSEVRDAVLRENTSFPFIRGAIARVGFRRIGLPYKRQKRIAGETHYNLIGMIIFAVAGIMSSSTLALRIPIYLFPVWLAATAVLGGLQITTGNPWLLLANALLACTYLGGTLAFTAVYVARTYKNGLQRPNYVIHRRFTHMQHD